MSAETQTWLENNILVGFTDKRGEAWWSKGTERADGTPNHYAGAVPVEDVREKLFNWQAEVVSLRAVRAGADAEVTDNGVTPAVSALDLPTRFQAIYRPDTGDIFDRAFAGSYKLHQYDEWLLENVASILDDSVQIGSAGLLKRGQIAWVQVEAPETRTVAGVEFRPFITAASSMNGIIATQYRRNVQVVVCDNTLSAALKEDSDSSVIKFRHTKNSLDNVMAARDALGIIFDTADEFAAEVERLTAVKVSNAKFAKWADAAADLAKAQADAKGKGKESTRTLTNSENKRDALVRLWNHDERVHPWAGTAYGVVAAWNTYVHHEQRVANQSREEANQLRVVRGYVGQEDQYALDLLARV